jgi:MscS family membrane protein
VLLALLVLGLPTAQADSLGGSDLLATPVGALDGSVALRGTFTHQLILYNNGTAPFLVLSSVLGDPGLFSVTVLPASVVLRPGEDATVALTVTAPFYSESTTLILTLRVEATDLSTGVAYTGDFAASTRLTGSSATDPEGKILGVFENALPAPLDTNLGAFLVTVGIWLLLSAGLVLVIDPFLRSFAKRTATQVDDILLKIIRGPVFALVVFFGTINSLEIIGLPADWLGMLNLVFGFAAVLIATGIAYRIFRDVLVYYGRRLAKRTASDIDDRLIPALEKIGGVIILLIGTLSAVSYLGFDITLFLAGFGVAGLIIAFAAQETLSNFFASLHIMVDRPFRVGDLIELEPGVICEVREIGFRSTKLYWGKHHDIIVMPNKELAARKIINYVRPDRRFKILVDVGVGYGSDIDRVKRVMEEVALAHPNILQGKEFAPIFRLASFGDSAIGVTIIAWVDDVNNNWQVASDLREAIKKRFAAEGIEIPFPQRVVHSPAPPEARKT